MEDDSTGLNLPYLPPGRNDRGVKDRGASDSGQAVALNEPSIVASAEVDVYRSRRPQQNGEPVSTFLAALPGGVNHC